MTTSAHAAHQYDPHRLPQVLGTVGAAAAHAYLAALGFLGLLDYTVPTRVHVLDQMAGSGLWKWIHAAVAIGLVLVLLSNPHRRLPWPSLPRAAVMCSIGFAAMLVWAFFSLVWGLTTIRPVSLAGPGLAFVVAAGEQLLAYAWDRGALTKDR